MKKQSLFEQGLIASLVMGLAGLGHGQNLPELSNSWAGMPDSRSEFSAAAMLNSTAYSAPGLAAAGEDEGSESSRDSLVSEDIVEVNVAMGVLFDGTLDISGEIAGQDRDVERDTDAGFIFRTGVDVFPLKYFGGGVYTSFAATEVEETADDLDYFEIGIALKARLPLEDVIGSADFLLTPGLSIGYRRLLFDTSGVDDANGLAINFGVDFRLRFNTIDVFIEPGFITQPAGGNSDLDVEFDPIGYMMFGVGFAF